VKGGTAMGITSRIAPAESLSDAVDRAYRGYGAGDEMPLGGYTAIMAVFAAAAAALTGAAARKARKRSGALPMRFDAMDLVLLGIGTHKLTRIITKDWVTAPLRAPFTEYKGSVGAGEVQEKSRGHGVRRAVGDLLTCQFCTGPWVAGFLTAGLLLAPRLTRLAAGALVMVTISDWLHITYERVRKSG
jgi:hypothetical protein